MIVSLANKIPSDSSDLDQVEYVGFFLNQAAMRIRIASAEALLPLDITPPQLRALETIAGNQPLSQARLGQLVHMDRTTIVHLVDHFEKIGVASREPDPADRRSHAIKLTANGHQILVAGRARTKAVEERFLSSLSHPERETLRSLLRKLFDPMPCPEENDREPSPSPTDT